MAGYVSFLGHRTQVGRAGLDHRERLVVAFFGVRGVGSIYYVAYAGGCGDLPRGALAVVDRRLHRSRCRCVLHGILATPVMRRLDRDREDAEAAAA